MRNIAIGLAGLATFCFGNVATQAQTTPVPIQDIHFSLSPTTPSVPIELIITPKPEATNGEISYRIPPTPRESDNRYARIDLLDQQPKLFRRPIVGWGLTMRDGVSVVGPQVGGTQVAAIIERMSTTPRAPQ